MTLLRFEHKRIASMAADLTAIVNEPAPPEPLKFLAFRREFGRTLAVHLAREDSVIYPRLFADVRPDVHALATRLAAEALAFSAAYREYSRQWTTVRIAADWPGFRKETLKMLVRLQHRVHIEDNELYPLVDGADQDQSPQDVGLSPLRVAAAANSEGFGCAGARR